MVNKNAIFLCVGDKEIFGSYVIENLLGRYDLIVNYFGSNLKQANYFEKHAKFFQKQSGTKFLSLKNIVVDNPKIFNQYDYIVCFDDDATIINGSIDRLIEIMTTFDMKILSPAHHNNGKISHNLMRTYPGNHVVRFTNFVEMTFPIFKKTFIIDYLNAYDGSCCGYGNDWWYMNLIDKKGENYDVGICDEIIVHNPKNSKNKNNISEYKSKRNRRKEWEESKKKYLLSQWTPKTIAYVHEMNDQMVLTPTNMMP
jgi:hypothetical protein